MTELINLTPHPIRLYDHDAPNVISDSLDGLIAVIPPTSPPARVAEVDLGLAHSVAFETYTNGMVSIPVQAIQYGEVHDLPMPRPDVFLIVPLVVLLAVTTRGYRSDLVAPARAVRNTDGTVIGCRAFAIAS